LTPDRKITLIFYHQTYRTFITT